MGWSEGVQDGLALCVMLGRSLGASEGLDDGDNDGMFEGE